MNLGTLLTAMVTPFDRDGQLDVKRAKELAVRLVDQGSDGLVVTGTTGESPTLSLDEKAALWQAVVDAVGDRVTVIAGTGTNNTASSIDATRRAEAAGVHGVLLVAPYYNRPSPEGLFQHFRAIASKTRLDVMLYNIPVRTGVDIPVEVTLRLARECPNVRAQKESQPSLDGIGRIVRDAPRGFQMFSGDDSQTLPAMAVGAVGVVSVAAHVVGPQMREMVDAFRSGALRRAQELHQRLLPVFKGLFAFPSPAPVKCALRYVGFDCGGVRLPLVGPAGHEEDALKDVLHQAGVI